MSTGFYKRFEALCSDHALSKKNACIAIGISSSAWQNWQKGKLPNAATQAKIARYFNISIDELMGIEESEKNPVLTEEQVALVKAFAKLGQEDKAFVMRIINLLPKG